MPNTDAIAASIEFRFLLDRAFAAHEVGRREVADAFARAAEAILRSAFPEIADDIAQAASRKGQGDVMGARLALHLDAASAACAVLVLTLRGARRRVVDALASAFGHHPEFTVTMTRLCARVLSTSSPAPDAPLAAMEVAAAYRR